MSLIGVVADIHGNMPALEAVMEHATGIDRWCCAGDIVGYGPFPVECVRAVCAMDCLAVAGNHDLGSIGGIGLDGFNADARAACRWTMSVLDDESRSYLEALPLRATSLDFLLVHGSPADPVWEYVMTAGDALANAEGFRQRICFNGHTHVPAMFSWPGETPSPGRDAVTTERPGAVPLVPGQGRRCMINVGSVGQPRDLDSRACYVTYDPGLDEIRYHRVDYDVARTAERMREAGLPRFLSDRLRAGR